MTKQELNEHLHQALMLQEAAENANANCEECGGEGDWAHCSLCSVLFGNAIDARHAVLAEMSYDVG